MSLKDLKPNEWHGLGSVIQDIRETTRHIAADNIEIASLRPQAELEDAMVSYGRDPGPYLGAGKRLKDAESTLAARELWVRRAQIMESFATFEAAVLQGDEYLKNMADLTAQLTEDPECDAWIRYQRGDRPVYGNPAWGVPNVTPPKPPEKAPSAERLAKHRQIEGAIRQLSTQGHVVQTLNEKAAMHPEFAAVVNAAKSAEIAKAAAVAEAEALAAKSREQVKA